MGLCGQMRGAVVWAVHACGYVDPTMDLWYGRWAQLFWRGRNIAMVLAQWFGMGTMVWRGHNIAIVLAWAQWFGVGTMVWCGHNIAMVLAWAQ